MMSRSSINKSIIFTTFLLCLGSLGVTAQDKNEPIDSLQFQTGRQFVNQCTPWHHVKCVFITGKEVYRDGRDGESTRHWWRKSYIGRACTDRYGDTLGDIFEALFVVPHYTCMAVGNGCGLLVYVIRGSREEVEARKQRRKKRRES